MKRILKITIVLVLSFVTVSCWTDKTKPNYQYMPDMYKSVPYDTYTVNPNYTNGMTSQTPVAGTIARGQVTYDYKDTEEGYQKAKTELKNALPVNSKNLTNGKKMYDIYCAICHGEKGEGDGTLVQREKFLGIPNYKDRDITEGSIYHVIMYGKNTMGSHASQLTPEERWQVTMYVQKLRNELIK